MLGYTEEELRHLEQWTRLFTRMIVPRGKTLRRNSSRENTGIEHEWDANAHSAGDPASS